MAQVLDVEKHYTGQTIQFVVGAAADSSYMRYARFIGRHMVKYVPGNPSISFKSMPGASSRKAGTWMYNIAKKDGLTIAAVCPGFIIDLLVGASKDSDYDPQKFKYFGSAASSVLSALPAKTRRQRRLAEHLTSAWPWVPAVLGEHRAIRHWP
jgi:tripartite-type tricarboxylate transporter receptor subunit TctC